MSITRFAGLALITEMEGALELMSQSIENFEAPVGLDASEMIELGAILHKAHLQL
jgi:hypothetical protein